MRAPSIEELLRRVEASGTDLGKRATALSTKITDIQRRLQQLPGKATVEITDGDVKLSFDRSNSNEWCLWYRDKESKAWEPLTGQSVLKKAGAVLLLPRLFEQLEKVQVSQLEQVERALSSLPLETSVLEGR